jgi:hypothetical protein
MHLDARATVASAQDRCLVQQVLQVGAGEAGRLRDHRLQVHALGERLAASVQREDMTTGSRVRRIEPNLSVEPAGPKQRGVEHVRAVRRRHHDHAGAEVEAVHLHQKLIQRLLALLVGVPARATTPTPNGVDLVHENDAAPVLSSRLEQVTYSGGAHAHVHLDEVRARGAQERHPGLAGDRPSQKRFPVPRRAHQQDAARDARPDRQEALGLAQELDDLGELLFRLICPGDVGEARRRALGHQPDPRRPRRGAGTRAGRHRRIARASGRPATAHDQIDGEQRQRHAEQRHQQRRRRLILRPSNGDLKEPRSERRHDRGDQDAKQNDKEEGAQRGLRLAVHFRTLSSFADPGPSPMHKMCQFRGAPR